jgi:Ca2+-binding EF-hand superfamily protein
MAFDRIDRDRNGFLSIAELAQELGADRELSTLVREADRNGDGRIDYQVRRVVD